MSDENNSQGVYIFIDIAKLIFAYIIVAIHIKAFSEFSIGDITLFDILNRYLFDIAVPFFFASITIRG